MLLGVFVDEFSRSPFLGVVGRVYVEFYVHNNQLLTEGITSWKYLTMLRKPLD